MELSQPPFFLSTFFLSSLLFSLNVPFFKISCIFISLFSLALLVQVEGAAVLRLYTGLAGVGSDSSPLPAELAPSQGKGVASRESQEQHKARMRSD